MIVIDQVKKTFGDHDVLKGVSFSVKKGEVYGLIGKNGTGKTTLMNIMAGLSSADSGTCTVGGKIINPDNHIIKIGYLPDLPAFFEYLTVGEYLSYLLMDKNPERKNKLLQLVDLSEKNKISTMSRGMRQRLGIAAAIVNDPEIILLDEPTSALDPSGRADVMRILSELKKEGKAIILSTHILADMERVCDRVGFLSDGIIKKSMHISELDSDAAYIRVIFEKEGNYDDILNSSGISYEKLPDGVYRLKIDENASSPQKRIFSMLASDGIKVASIHSEVKNLDLIFQEVCG